jgi:Predicted ATPase
MKVLATNIFEHAVETDQEIGQLLFDPAGEYANVNTQDDETALADIHDDVVTVYSWGGGGDDVESLQIDFFDYEQIDEVWQTIKLHLTRDRDYVNSFKAANPVAPEQQGDNQGEVNEAVRCQSVLYACLIRAGFETPNGFRTPIPTNAAVRDAVNAHVDDNDPDFENSGFGAPGWSFVNENRLEEFWDIVANNRDDINDADEDWITNDVEAMLVMFNQEAGNGYQILEDLRRYHDPGTQGYYPDIIYDSLADGDIVIVDLTSGTDEINQRISKTIVERVVERQVDMFTNGQEPHNMEVYVEEAHRLFGSDYLDDADATDPYVRLAKEAAKYNIGLIYATQEVSGVDGRVLANTANWIVTHLNNRNETRELSRYYNFEDFERLTLEAEDVGFARVKTLSGQFIVPTQIDKFDQDLITRAGDRYEQRYGDDDDTLQEAF